MVNVVVARKRTIQVSANATSGVLDTTVPVTIKNTPSIGTIGSTYRLDHLQDVSATNETDGAIPIYDSSIDKYVVRQIDLGDLGGGIDGGTF